MKQILTSLCLSIAVLLGSAGVSWSADYEKGITAYQSGDYATAIREFQPLAEQGNIDAQVILGHMFEEGYGVDKNLKSAIFWYKNAAEQGDSDAQRFLGEMFAEGLGVTKDLNKSHYWYYTCARQKNTDCLVALGIIYAEGIGVPRHPIFAYVWWDIAARNGRKDAEKNRDIIAKKLDSSMLKEAMVLSLCFDSNFKKCPELDTSVIPENK